MNKFNITIRVPARCDLNAVVEAVKAILKPGDNRVYIFTVMDERSGAQGVGLPGRYEVSSQIIATIKAFAGVVEVEASQMTDEELKREVVSVTIETATGKRIRKSWRMTFEQVDELELGTTDITALHRAAEILQHEAGNMALYEQRDECGFSPATTREEFFAHVHPANSEGIGSIEAPPKHLSINGTGAAETDGAAAPDATERDGMPAPTDAQIERWRAETAALPEAFDDLPF